MVCFKCSPAKSNVHPGVSIHGSLLLWKVPWIKSQEPEVQAPKSKSNSWAILYAHFWASFVKPANSFIRQRTCVLCPIDRFRRVCEIILITCNLFSVYSHLREFIRFLQRFQKHKIQSNSLTRKTINVMAKVFKSLGQRDLLQFLSPPHPRHETRGRLLLNLFP